MMRNLVRTVRSSCVRIVPLLTISCGLFFLAPSAQAACNPLLSEAIRAIAEPDVKDIGCLPGGVNKKRHQLTDVCYDPGDTQSRLSANLKLHCRTSPAAFIQVHVRETLHLNMTVRNSDCEIIRHSVTARGSIGRIIASTAEAFGVVRPALQRGVRGACQ